MAEEVTVTVDDSQETVSLFIDSGGITDHTELSNIGVKTHATLDTEVGLNNAKVTFPEAPNDGTQYARKSLGWEAVASGGGGEFQNYDFNFWVDSSNIANWMALAWFNTVPAEYTQSTVVATASAITDTSIFARKFLGVAKGNQTIDSFELFVGASIPTALEKVSIFKVKYTDADVGTIDYATILYEGAITLNTAGYFSLTDTDFTVTSIADKDIIYVYYHSTSTSNVGVCYMRLKCSID